MLCRLATMRLRGLNPVMMISSSFLQGTASRRSGSTLPQVRGPRFPILMKSDEEREEISEDEIDIYNKWEEICNGVSEGRRKEWTSYSLYSYVDDPFLHVAGRRALRREDLLKPKDVVLFQYERCPMGNKVKAFLEYCDIPYIAVHVTPITKKQIKWSHNKELPIFVVDGQPTVDSSDLINKIVKRMHPDYDLNNDEEKKWREWVDNYLVHVVSAYIYRTFPETLRSFRYVAPEAFNYILAREETLPQIIKAGARRLSYLAFPNPLRIPKYLAYLSLSERLQRLVTLYGGAAAMHYEAKKLKEKHNFTDECAALYGAAEQWVDALGDRKFLGGWDNPNLADLAVFGALCSVFWQNSGYDIKNHTRIRTWYSDMSWAMGSYSSYHDDNDNTYDISVYHSSLNSLRARRLNSGEFYDEEFVKKDLA